LVPEWGSETESGEVIGHFFALSMKT
jgi:hypothetical protein